MRARLAAGLEKPARQICTACQCMSVCDGGTDLPLHRPRPGGICEFAHLEHRASMQPPAPGQEPGTSRKRKHAASADIGSGTASMGSVRTFGRHRGASGCSHASKPAATLDLGRSACKRTYLPYGLWCASLAELLMQVMQVQVERLRTHPGRVGLDYVGTAIERHGRRTCRTTTSSRGC